MEKIEYQKIPLVQTIEEISSVLLMHRRYEKDLLLNIGDVEKQKRYLRSFEAQNELIYKKLAFIEKIISEDKATYHTLSDNINAIYPSLEKYIAGVKSVAQYLMQHPEITPQMGNSIIDEFKNATYETESNVNTLVKESIEIITTVLDNERVSLANYQIITLITMLVGTIIVSIVMFITYRSITHPLNAVISYAKELEGGNYDAELKGNFVAEMAALSAVLSSMAENLKIEIQKAYTETEHANKAL